MEEYTILLDRIKIAIDNDDVVELEKDLLTLPWEEFTQSTLNMLLTTFVNQAINYKSKKAIKTIYKVLYNVLPIESGQLDHLASTFMLPAITIEALQLVVETYKAEKPIEYYFEYLMAWDAKPEILIAAKTLDELFKHTDNTTWRYLYNLSLTYYNDNQLIQDYLSTKVRINGPVVSKPSYIIDYSNNTTDIEEPMDWKLPPLREAIKILSIIGNNDQDYVDKVVKQYKNANYQERYNIIKPYLLSIHRHNLYDNVEVFRLYGPSNTVINDDLSGNDICSRLGCRMFTCNEFERDDKHYNTEEIEIEVDVDLNNIYDEQNLNNTAWYTGSCDFCLNTIQKLQYAVRMPLSNGGWLGCYCSFICVKADTDVRNCIVIELIDIIEKQLDTVGIYDAYKQDTNM
jgi:hypothetical protein